MSKQSNSILRHVSMCLPLFLGATTLAACGVKSGSFSGRVIDDAVSEAETVVGAKVIVGDQDLISQVEEINEDETDTVSDHDEPRSREEDVQERQINGVAFRVKDSSELRDAISACAGEDVLLLDDAMQKEPASQVSQDPAQSPDAEGRFPFLSPGFLEQGNGERDILVKFRSQLHDPLSLDRTSTSANALTLSYMSSLATVADVVAYNCEIGPGEQCDCSTEDAAEKMIARCVPHLNIKQREVAAQALLNSCQGDPLNSRQAIASLLSSTLFAEKK